MRNNLNIGDRVIKNVKTWIANEFDEWGRGEGVGIVIKPQLELNEDEFDVFWPAGRCFETGVQLLKEEI